MTAHAKRFQFQSSPVTPNLGDSLPGKEGDHLPSQLRFGNEMFSAIQVGHRQMENSGPFTKASGPGQNAILLIDAA
jgi:hypothetical protein